ncbi:MCE family protein [Actinomadura sp. HBU206391]|uniref:MCE family protein n=1 Tax=Actinomadura sp. HBU206391 TaxID=2731692 RepID=UPI00164FCAFE|nr:MlaD family protein [Actinomadura sp. HBU206391]MBC6461373.1 MCE family protein [Actinomadura sp. HBU206391]
MVRPFRERNPVPMGLIGLGVIVAGLVFALNLQNIPFIAGGTTYNAAFAEAAGLKKDEEVRIAGVKVGKVTGLRLERGHVRVDFRVDDGVRLGDLTRAEIKIKTVLGAHYVSLDPRGPGRQDPERQIPVSRTATPFEIVPAISELSERAGDIDTKQLAQSLDVLSSTFENSPEEIKGSLRGLRRLSQTISSRDDQLHELVGRSKNVTKVLADRNAQLVKLVEDGDKILRAVQARRAVIHQLLVNTVTLTQQVNALISENDKEIGPMLANLQRVNKILLKNQDDLDRTIRLLAPYGRQFTDATGSGRWFDSYIQNLVPIPASIQKSPVGGSGRQRTPESRSPSTNPLPFLP